MATTTPNFGWPVPTSTDLVKNGATAIEGLGDAIDASLLDLKGGTTGQVLAKASGTDMDFSWVAQDDSNAIQNAIVDAKGDLIAATANDTPARLAVGNNGETLVADSSTSTGLRYQATMAAGRNAVINGGMDIWQRGTSVAVAASTVAYTADRLSISTAASQASTVSRQATNDTTNLPNIQYCARVQRNSGQTGTGTMYVGNSIETINSIPFTGKAVTVSFYARKGADYSPTSSALNLYLWNGTGTDQNVNTGYTGANVVASVTATLTTTWQRFSFTGTVPTNSTELALQYQSVPTGTASTNDYYEITGIQLEIGSVATAFSRAGGNIQGELAACLYYFNRIADFSAGGSNGQQMIVTAQNFATTGGFGVLQYPKMRISPTVSFSGNADFIATGAGGNNIATTAMAANSIKPNSAEIRYTTASGLVAGNAALCYTTSSTGKIDLSAEL